MPKDDFHFHRTDVWREGQWIDMWSLVHLLSGLATGFGFAVATIAALPSLVLSFTGFVAYEAWEAFVQIEETAANRFMDIVVGVAGFLASYFLLTPLVSETRLIEAFIGTIAVASVLSFFGWRASVKAAALKTRMRARREARKARRIQRQRARR